MEAIEKVFCGGGYPGDGKEKSVFTEAEDLIHGQRAKDYGKAAASFHHIAELWSAYLGYIVSSKDVAVMMALLKFSRLQHSNFEHHDSIVDALGYIGLIDEI
ncbi:MAG: hypothetical protein HDQ88_10785 [Clostridia bacterium]|nr:hypothetical protein [Clostridia bacterium]